jgi:phosphohistidine phosphatase SixA
MSRPGYSVAPRAAHTRRHLLAVAGATTLGLAGRRPALATDRLDQPGTVVALRHALAPGTGDPPGFVLGDCTTQRNLDARGREQARAIGERLRAAGLAGAAVYSSRWCRCLETAELLALGPVTPLPALDSFFGRPSEREPRTQALRAFLAEAGPGGPPLVLVTHQVNISALAGRGTRSGEGVVLDRDPGGTLTERATLPPPPV